MADLLHTEIMVANHRYLPELADCCRENGRKYGLWAWYSSDQEITASLHVEAERLGREFGHLPAKAATDLAFASLPNNCHGLSDATMYVTAGLLWDTDRDPFDLLREFCRLVFGPKIADALFLGYQAIARIRNRDVRGDSAFDDGYLGAGGPAPKADAELAENALDALRATQVDSAWIPKLPLVTPREQLLADLIEHVRLIAQYARFREKFRTLTRKGGIIPADLASLPPVDPLQNSGGMIEWRKATELKRRFITQ